MTHLEMARAWIESTSANGDRFGAARPRTGNHMCAHQHPSLEEAVECAGAKGTVYAGGYGFSVEMLVRFGMADLPERQPQMPREKWSPPNDRARQTEGLYFAAARRSFRGNHVFACGHSHDTFGQAAECGRRSGMPLVGLFDISTFPSVRDDATEADYLELTERESS